jgi:hypothetical protein
MSSRRSTTRRTEERLDSAEERLRDEVEDVEQLDAELARELEGIWATWKEAVWKVEQVDVRLEKNDISIGEIVVVWGMAAGGAE